MVEAEDLRDASEFGKKKEDWIPWITQQSPAAWRERREEKTAETYA